MSSAAPHDHARYLALRRSILRRALIAPLITVLLLCATLVYLFAASLRHRVDAELSAIAEGHRSLIEQFLAEREYDLEFAGKVYSFDELRDRARLMEVLNRLSAGSRVFLDLGVFDQDGTHVAYVGPYSNLEGKNYAGTEWFKAVKAKGVYISDVFLGFRNYPHFIVAVKREEGGRAWYLRATVDTAYFNELVENVRVGKTGEAYLVNQEGVFQTSRRSGGKLMTSDPDWKSYRRDPDQVVAFTAGDRAGEQYLYATGRLAATGWTLVVRQELSEAYAPLYRAIAAAAAIIFGGGAVAALLAFLLAGGLANRLALADLEKRQMSYQLIMAGKLAEVGEMSAGLAHEINNPLQVMKAEQMLMQDLIHDLGDALPAPDEPKLQMIADSIAQLGTQIDRVKQITQGLLGFASRHEPEPRFAAIDLKTFLPEAVRMADYRARLANVRVIQKLAAGIPPLISDASLLEQVLLNLLNNALYALRGRPDPEIQITAVSDEKEVKIVVADNGPGIAPENLKKIFLPFFTTKPAGKGTGLGLSTSWGIMQSLGGEITVESQVDKGAAFTLILPLAGPPLTREV